jgi:hypothetical protein
MRAPKTAQTLILLTFDWRFSFRQNIEIRV